MDITPVAASGSFERHAQSVVQGIITILLVWIGFTAVDLGKTVAKLEVQNAQYTQQIAELKSEIKALREQVTVAALAAAQAATAAALASLPVRPARP